MRYPICGTVMSFLMFMMGPIIACGLNSSSDTLKSHYDEYLWHFEGEKEVKTTKYHYLVNTSTIGLSAVSLQMRQRALAVYENPESRDVKQQYIRAFPDNFAGFLKIFGSSSSGALSEGNGIYVDLFGSLCGEYPQEVVETLLNISKSAVTTDDDATGMLQGITADCGVTQFEVFLKSLRKRPLAEQKNISSFLADVESIEDYPEYEKILKLLKKHGEKKLYNIFLNSKANRIKQNAH